MTGKRILECNKFSERWATCDTSVPPVKPRRRGSMHSVGTSDGDSDMPPRYPRRTSNIDTSSTSCTSDESIDDDNKKLNIRHSQRIQPKHDVNQKDCIIGMEIIIFVNWLVERTEITSTISFHESRRFKEMTIGRITNLVTEAYNVQSTNKHNADRNWKGFLCTFTILSRKVF